MAFFKHQRDDDDGWEMVARQNAYGYCPICQRQSTATKSTFKNGMIEYRAHCCNKIVAFCEGSDNFNNPYVYPPSKNGQDGEQGQTGSGRYSKGKR